MECSTQRPIWQATTGAGRDIAPARKDAGNGAGSRDREPIRGTAGAVVGSWVGTRRASGGAGDPWLTALGSVAGAAAGIGAGYLVGEPLGSIPLGIAVGLPIAIAFPAIVEIRTSR
jgi:hypothetical protein